MAILADAKLLLAVEPEKLLADFPIPGLNATLADFWSWAYSDTLGNTVRPIFAEFMIASALGITSRPRIEWDAVDLTFKGRLIEVKSAAYLQSWPQRALSKVRFEIGRKRSFHAVSGLWEEKPIRCADCYVFCLFHETAHERRNSRAVLNVESWTFYVVGGEQIECKFGAWKSIGLAAIQQFQECNFAQLKSRIEEQLHS